MATALQLAAGVVGGSGAWGEPIGTIANSYPTLLLPAGTAFTIWSLIYAATSILAVRAALPGQRHRRLHRRTGWWLAAAGTLNAAWIALFAQREIVLAEFVIIALLGVLGTALARVSALPAQNWADRLLLHTPISVYTGWVTAATVVGAATTGAAVGVNPEPSWAVTIAALAVLATAAAVAIIGARTYAAGGYLVAVAWALTWIAVAGPALAVTLAAIVGVLTLAVTFVLRLPRTHRPSRVAWG